MIFFAADFMVYECKVYRDLPAGATLRLGWDLTTTDPTTDCIYINGGVDVTFLGNGYTINCVGTGCENYSAIRGKMKKMKQKKGDAGI